jgi:hypothetical protein
VATNFADAYLFLCFLQRFVDRTIFSEALLAVASRGRFFLHRIAGPCERGNFAKSRWSDDWLDDTTAAARLGVRQAQAVCLDAWPGDVRIDGRPHELRHMWLAAEVYLPRSICLICLGLMWLESVLGLCLGCEIHGILVRRGWAAKRRGVRNLCPRCMRRSHSEDVTRTGRSLVPVE